MIKKKCSQVQAKIKIQVQQSLRDQALFCWSDETKAFGIQDWSSCDLVWFLLTWEFSTLQYDIKLCTLIQIRSDLHVAQQFLTWHKYLHSHSTSFSWYACCSPVNPHKYSHVDGFIEKAVDVNEHQTISNFIFYSVYKTVTKEMHILMIAA